jgi:hypothetical protein
MTTLLEMTNRVLQQVGQQTVTTVANADTPVVQTVMAINHIVETMHLSLNSYQIVQSATMQTAADTPTVTPAVEVTRVLPDSLNINDADLVETTSTSMVARHLDELTGQPTHFYRLGDNLYLLPVPDAVFTIHYQYRTVPPTVSGDDDVIDTPEGWQTAVQLGSQALLEKFLGEDNFALTYQLYQQRVDMLKAQSLRQPGQRFQGPSAGYHG